MKVDDDSAGGGPGGNPTGDPTACKTEGRSDARTVLYSFGMIANYIGNTQVSASDFESGIKARIAEADVEPETKKNWFLGEYSDADDFGKTVGGPLDGTTPNTAAPNNHPVISVRDGLTSSSPGGNSTAFSTTGIKQGCGFAVVEDSTGSPASCNLSPLAAYNYLNTSFSSDAMTLFSSNKATSGFTRENHMAVSQVGTGPAKFMYWSNSAVLLGSISLLGFWYAIGMLAGAIKRTFSLVAAIAFATLGAIQAIAKVVVYSVALILQVIVTLFLYQFVSEFPISVPSIMSGPVWLMMDANGLLGSPVLGGVVVVVLTFISTLVIIGVTFALLRARKVVLQAMNEVFTKLVDKFLDTNTAPAASNAPKGGMLPALASGLGAGAGNALGKKLVGGGLGKREDSAESKTEDGNAAGTNAPRNTGELVRQGMRFGGSGEHGDEVGGHGDHGLDDGPDGRGGGSAIVESSDPHYPATVIGRDGADSASSTAGALEAGESATNKPLELAGSAPRSYDAKALARQVSNQGGLSDLGYSSPHTAGTAGTAGTASTVGRADGRADSGAGSLITMEADENGVCRTVERTGDGNTTDSTAMRPGSAAALSGRAAAVASSGVSADGSRAHDSVSERSQTFSATSTAAAQAGTASAAASLAERQRRVAGAGNGSEIARSAAAGAVTSAERPARVRARRRVGVLRSRRRPRRVQASRAQARRTRGPSWPRTLCARFRPGRQVRQVRRGPRLLVLVLMLRRRLRRRSRVWPALLAPLLPLWRHRLLGSLPRQPPRVQ